MEMIFQEDYAIVWMAALALALFLPVRKLVWVMYVRRAERRSGPTEEAERRRLRNRASVTAALLCFVFSALYVNHLFSS